MVGTMYGSHSDEAVLMMEYKTSLQLSV